MFSKVHIKLGKVFTRAITIIYSFLCDFHIKIALARKRQQFFTLKPLDDVITSTLDVITYNHGVITLGLLATMSLLSKDAFCTVKLSSSSSLSPTIQVGSQTWYEVRVRPTPREANIVSWGKGGRVDLWV